MIRLNTLGTLALRGVDGEELRSVLTQPKRLALLCYLAVESPRGFQRRDQLFGLFWPELSQSQARQALRQSLYFLRHSLGDQVVNNRGSDEIGIAPDAVRCDACTFTELCQDDRLDDALSLYRGDFLSGFFVDDASSAFEHWLYSTRDALRQRAIGAAWKLADRATTRADATEAARWARFASRLDPEDELSLQRLLRLLDSQGDRAGALRAYAEFAESLAAEFAAEPSAETKALIESVRVRTAASDVSVPPSIVRHDVPGEAPASARLLDVSSGATVASLATATPDPATIGLTTHSSANELRHIARRRALLALSVVIAGSVAAVTTRYYHHPTPPPTVAVGWIQDPSGADTSAITHTFAELLATDLARVPGMHVVSRARLYDMLGQLGIDNETPSGISQAARRAGATQLVEAVLTQKADSTTRVELRRIDLASGTAGERRTIQAASVIELANRATAELAAELNLSSPISLVGAGDRTSLVAQRLYDEGLRSFYRRDVPSAVRLFHAALTDDPTFAMAAYYAGLGEQQTDGLASRRDLALALRLSARASDRERLIIQQTWAYATNDPAQLAIAESLETRYPNDPDGELALGRALGWTGKFLEALPHLRRVVHMDSLSLEGRSPFCHACDALEAIITSYIAADSMDAAERVARDWTRMQPRVQTPWWYLASMLARQNRYDSALKAEQHAEQQSSDNAGDDITRATIDIGAGQFADADRLLGDMAQDGNVARRTDALWWTIISLRNQGRLREALAVAERIVRANGAEPIGFSTPQSLNAVSVAQVQFEMGHFRVAAAVFDSIANYAWKSAPDFTSRAPGLLARHRIWMTTQMATALASAHDTARLAMVCDSVAAWGPRSAFFRDRALVHYVRGLIAESRGKPAGAESEFRQARISAVDGYSRVSFELGKTLVAEGRPRDAIPVFQAPLHGSLEASNYYLTQTELHAALGDAFDRAGERDSALVHYRRVLSAWQGSDPEFRPRIAAIRTRMAAIESGRSGPNALGSPGRDRRGSATVTRGRQEKPARE